MDSDGEFSGEAFKAARIERDKTLVHLREVEDALSRAAGSQGWVDTLKSSLESLQKAMIDEQREATRPGSLLTLLLAEQPRRFGPRIRGIEEQYAGVVRQLETFRRELDRADPSAADIGDLRHRASWLIRAIHNCRNRQADLVFNALGLDLGGSHDR